MRIAEIKRKTAETDIELSLNLDGKGNYRVSTGNGFFDHMTELLAKHGAFDLDLTCKGDTRVDFHHSAEDIGICLGKAFSEALSDKAGINRYGSSLLPMDETLILCALDFSGRSYLNFEVKFPEEYKIGDFDVELIEEFLLALTRSAGLTLHVKQLAGSNMHHIAEGIFKALARALREAVAIDPRLSGILPSTKGTL